MSNVVYLDFGKQAIRPAPLASLAYNTQSGFRHYLSTVLDPDDFLDFVDAALSPEAYNEADEVIQDLVDQYYQMNPHA